MATLGITLLSDLFFREYSLIALDRFFLYGTGSKWSCTEELAGNRVQHENVDNRNGYAGIG